MLPLLYVCANQRASDSGEQSTYGGNYDASEVLSQLPPGLGQAASTLTSFASSFKRSNAPVIGPDEDLTQTAALHGTSAALGDAPPPPGMEHDLQQAQQAHSVHAQHKSAHDPTHDSAATAAALAAMGTLAGRHLQQHGQHHVLADAGRDSMMGDDSPVGLGDGLGGARYRRKGPELDRQRKDNHKEVERRRRSAINDGIVQLSQIVPGCDVKNTNKGSIIIAAVRYIQDLKNNEASNIEKWTLEKLLMDQAMNDLSVSLEESRREVERMRAQVGMTDTGGDKRVGHTQGYDPRFQQYHGDGNGMTDHHGQDIAAALEQQGVAHESMDPFAQQHKAEHIDGSEANKRARLV